MVYIFSLPNFFHNIPALNCDKYFHVKDITKIAQNSGIFPQAPHNKNLVTAADFVVYHITTT